MSDVKVEKKPAIVVESKIIVKIEDVEYELSNEEAIALRDGLNEVVVEPQPTVVPWTIYYPHCPPVGYPPYHWYSSSGHTVSGNVEGISAGVTLDQDAGNSYRTDVPSTHTNFEEYTPNATPGAKKRRRVFP